MKNINPTKGNGLTTPHSQPVKRLTKYAADFTAMVARFATADHGVSAVFVVVLTQAVFMALMGVRK